VAALIGAALTRYFWVDEGTIPNILFTTAVTASLIALVVRCHAGSVRDRPGGPSSALIVAISSSSARS